MESTTLWVPSSLARPTSSSATEEEEEEEEEEERVLKRSEIGCEWKDVVGVAGCALILYDR
jgi:hypothetical protein